MDVAILKRQAMIEVCVCVHAYAYYVLEKVEKDYFQLQCEDRQTTKKKT